MPDFPKIGGATAAEVWASATRKLTGIDGQARTDLMGEDATFEAGTGVRKARIDAAITTRATQAQIISDATPFPGANVNAAVTTRAAAADYTAGRAAKMDKIQDFLEEGVGTLTADGTEQIVRDYTGTGRLHAYIDLTAMLAGDTTVIRQFMKVKVAGAYIKYAEETYSGAQTLSLLHVIMKPGKNGVKVTLQQTAGVNRAYDWETFAQQAAA